jgi:cytochrome c-type biogenesis protein CcmF
LFTGIIGLFLLRVKWQLKNRMFFFYLLTALFLLTLLYAKSPFATLTPQMLGITPEQFPPADGRGLNPLLQNFWMIIHPPIIFLGYTFMAVPFAFALAALSANDYKNWAKKTLPWSLISSAVLGLGIFLGGYWAYETLGWGGYWAWDPVENSSLIPWLTNLALIHGMLIERSRGTLRKTNLFLALIGYLLVLYGTFLTRSGILQEFSVHSFTDLGINSYLIVFMVGFLILSLVMFIYRLPSLTKTSPLKERGRSYETLMILGALFTILLAVLTWVGTSWPVITTILGNPSDVNQDFYNRIAFPIAIVMAVLTVLTTAHLYFSRGKDQIVRHIIISAAIALVLCAISFTLGIRKLNHLIYLFTAYAAIAINLQIIVAVTGTNLLRLGGQLSHIGLGVALIGFLVSSLFARSSDLVKLAADQEKQVLDLNCRFLGLGENFFDPNNRVKIEVETGNGKYIADPVFYQDVYTRQTVINPYIRKHLTYDTYFAPQRYLPDYTTLTLSKGDSNSAYGYNIKFNEFKMESHATTGTIKVGAALDINTEDTTYNLVSYYSPDPVIHEEIGYTRIPKTEYRIYVDRVIADEGKIVMDVVGMGSLVVEVSKKPLINLVWLGSVLIVVGAVLAFINRFRQAEH